MGKVESHHYILGLFESGPQPTGDQLGSNVRSSVTDTFAYWWEELPPRGISELDAGATEDGRCDSGGTYVRTVGETLETLETSVVPLGFRAVFKGKCEGRASARRASIFFRCDVAVASPGSGNPLTIAA